MPEIARINAAKIRAEAVTRAMCRVLGVDYETHDLYAAPEPCAGVRVKERSRRRRQVRFITQATVDATLADPENRITFQVTFERAFRELYALAEAETRAAVNQLPGAMQATASPGDTRRSPVMGSTPMEREHEGHRADGAGAIVLAQSPNK